MTRKKWIALIVAAAVVVAALAAVLFWPRASIDETKNLIANGGFEAGSGSVPDSWAIGRWFWDEGVSYLSLSSDAYSGSASICVENAAENDARFEQTIAVEPNAYYRISCMVKAEGCQIERAGAGISLENTFVSSDYAYDTDGEWTRVTLYGKTGSNQKSMTVMCRVGGYGSLNVGKAWFDDVEVVRLASLPAGAVEKSLATNPPAKNDDALPGADESASRLAMPVVLAAALFALVSLAVMLWARRHPLDKKKSGVALTVALAVGVVVRVALAMIVRGFEVDVNCFEGWADRMAQFGPWGFYDAGWCDYPPGYMLILWPFGLIRNLLGIAYNSRLHWLLVKIPPIACDVLTGLFLVRISRKKLGESGAALLGAAYLLNPAVIFNSAVWGQVDGVLTLFLLLSVYCAARREWRWSLAAFAVAALCKPQALMFAPIGVLALACEVISAGENRKKTLLDIGSALLIAAGVMIAVALPFSLGQGRDPFTWLWGKYTESLGEYNYITVNACNLYQLMSMNWRALDAAGPWTYLGWASYPVAFGLAIWFHIKGKDRKNLFLLCAMALVVIYAFGAKMHERYLYPAIGLLLAAYAVDRDARELIGAIALSASLFANEVLVLLDTYLTDCRAAAAMASFVNVEAAQLLAWTAWDICVRGRRVELKAAMDGLLERSVLMHDDYKLRLTARDWAIMLSVTAVYAVLAFVNLGSMKAPQTAWTSSAPGENVTFELQNVEDFRLTYYGGICNSTFTVAFSDDGANWTEERLAMYDQGQIFRWIWYVPQMRGEDGKFSALESDDQMRTAKYIRVTAQQTGLVLHEIAFIDAEGTPLPIVNVSQAGGDGDRASDARLLVDEQDTVPAYPSYYNSTYFDEIYHARTGYEFAHSLNPYETTHPPLGKVLIMLGIEIFGMTPFGWRFMGALFGVMMLPAMYLVIKQLFKRTEYAALGMGLLALDAMHFTQTRIATIDTYGVFFILLMYLFMFRYCQMNFYTDGLKKTLPTLALCGVSMGLGIASKWICIYAAVGLAVLFFYTMLRRFLEHRQALRVKGRGAELRAAREDFWKNLLVTGAFCVIVFIVVPALIYYFSYYWYARPRGGLSLTQVLNSQTYMFNYHKDLTNDTHFFKTPWYEWPLIVKPMWYYTGTRYMPEGWISSISCMGNPAVWWVGIAALMFVRFKWWSGEYGRNGFYVVLGFMAQFLPWMLVPRSTFIYHYFASVPFIITCTVMFYAWLKKRSKKSARVFAGVLVGCAALLFAAFYPLESGLPTLRGYANLLRWFNWYNF